MKVECQLDEVFEVIHQKLAKEGLLLSSIGTNQEINVMTIGWGLMGRLWREPVFMVAVRPSRFTFELIEATDAFTVNIPTDGMRDTVDYCGEVSGRDHDKFQDCGLTALTGKRVKSPTIEECMAHIECQVIGKSTVHPDLISSSVQKACYPSNDYHTLYYGRIHSILKES